ncbi:MAG: AAA family ATPase [Anaerolineae bacterium]
MPTHATFAEWLKRKRREQGLTQETLAGLAGCSTVYLRKIETAERQPTRQVVEALLDALQVPEDAQPTYIELAFATPSTKPASVSTKPPASLPPLMTRQTSLVGRQGELEQLRQQWVHARAGSARIALLSGEPGIGKTRLAHELIALVAQEGATVLRGGCYEYEATTPYLPFVEALRAYAHAQPADTLRRRLGSTAPEIARLAPEIDAKIGPLTPNPTLPPNDERLRLFDNVARFLAALADARGLLFFLDDLHWADQASLSLLHYLLRNLPGERLLVLAAYREAELDRSHPLADALVAWHRERIATRLPLARLDATETAAMLATLFEQEHVSTEFAEAIYQETEGNPFFTEEVVKSLIEQGQIYREGEGWGRKAVEELTIPQSIKEAISRRLNRLSEPYTDTLRTAAALGKTFVFAELAAVSLTGEDALLDALDEASAAQLVRPEGAESFTFTHDKIRETLVEELNPVRRRRLHQRIGGGLEKLYAGQLDSHAAELAYHFVESADWQRGLAYARQAAEAAERVFAHDEAIKYLGLARDCAVALGDREQEAGIAERLGDVYAICGPASRAVENYSVALEMARTPSERARLKARIGTVCTEFGDMHGEAWLLAAVDELDPEVQRGELARALANLGRFQHYHGQHRRGIELLERALAIAEPLADLATVGTIFQYLAGAYSHLARYEESTHWAEQDLLLGQRNNDPHAIQSGLFYLAENSIWTGNWPKALDYIAQGRALAEAMGAQHEIAWRDFERAGVLHPLGELTTARPLVLDAEGRARRAGDVRGAAIFTMLRAQIDTDLALDESAQICVGEVLATASTSSNILVNCWARYAAAYFHVQREDWLPAATVLDEAAMLLAGTDHRAVALYCGSVHAEAHLGLGHIAEAARIGDDHLALAREAESHHFEAVSLRVRGQIRAAQGLFDEAEDAFAAAIAILEPSGARIEWGRALYHRAHFRHALGRDDLARIDLARARELFAACGAPRDLQRVETLDRDLGAPFVESRGG